MSYYCYLIVSGTRTYIGITNNLDRRLRQHNGEIKGGAKSTRISTSRWIYHTVIDGFETRGEAQQFEYQWKKQKGFQNRVTKIPAKAFHCKQDKQTS